MPDSREIEACIDRYYDSLHASNPDEVRKVFHENARITGYLPDGLHQMTVEDFAGFVAAQQPSPEASGAEKKLEILSCEIAGQTAGVRVRESYLGMVFLDTFGMIETEGRWTIYSKLFHVEG